MTPPAPRARSVGVDALRGVAILLVLVYHAGPLAFRLAPYDARGWLVWPRLSAAAWLGVPLLHFGFVGVHCFFVLSGFCIHLRAARERTARVPLGPFFRRRFWRIYPPYWIALALSVALLYGLRAAGIHSDWPPPGATDVALHAAMLHTLSARTFFSINPAFWSLATEEQLYLVYPLVAIALARFGARRVVTAALGLSIAWRAAVLALVPPTVEHFMTWRVLVHGLFLPRWFDWLLGCWLAEIAVDPDRLRALPARRALVVAFALLLAAGFATRAHVAVDKLLGDELYAAAFAALTAAVLRSPARLGPRLATRALAAVGSRAYGIYLVHQPLVDLLRLPLALRAALVAGASALFGRLCERPFEERSRRVAPR